MFGLHDKTRDITDLILRAAENARKETDAEPEPGVTRAIDWPVECTVGPGLEGAIACESKIGYVNGTKGWLIYRGYDIFDLCAHSSYEEVSYLLLFGKLPARPQLIDFRKTLNAYLNIPDTMRQLMTVPVERYNTMSALRLGTLFMRRHETSLDLDAATPEAARVIGSDEDSIAMETVPAGEEHAIYEFQRALRVLPEETTQNLTMVEDIDACLRLIAGTSTITAAVARLRRGRLPLSPHPELSHAANLLYMMTGREPTPVEERVMDVALILHADHGMNASTFAAMVVASTLSDIYFSVGAGIAALNGPLHGGANAEVLHMLHEIGAAANVPAWYEELRAKKGKVMGFGHRVYKAYDPRARVLGPLAKYLVSAFGSPEAGNLIKIATALEEQVVSTLGKEKKIFPNVDFYSGIVYNALDVPTELFTPIFAVSRVAGWTARVLEYLEDNRIFRPRAVYTGEFEMPYVPIDERV